MAEERVRGGTAEQEITFEITNFCRHHCRYCSSEVMDDYNAAMWLPIEIIYQQLKGRRFEHIIISGGEPLAHPGFYSIFLLCEMHTDDVVVYSNLIRHLIYNAGVIDGVYLEAKLTVTSETQKIGILKRIEQGKEAHRPEVTFSRNHDGPCDCKSSVVRPDGSIGQAPCSKGPTP